MKRRTGLFARNAKDVAKKAGDSVKKCGCAIRRKLSNLKKRGAKEAPQNAQKVIYILV
jgi:hypothetical protein